jgi:two-component system NtrC family sensor kinase
MPVLTWLLWTYGNSTYHLILTTKVRSDLASAQQYFLRLEELQAQQVLAFAQSEKLVRAYREHNSMPVFREILETQRLENRLSYLVFRSASQPPFLQHPSSGLVAMEAETLKGFSAGLPELASVHVLPTPNASPDEKKWQHRGLVMRSSAPVVVDGKTVGVLEGGLLLNRNLSITDNISDLVYPHGALLGDSRGTVTIFMDDVRVATNVTLANGSRAIGTRVSASVKEKVLGRGEVWFDLAFVVNDWFMSGYAPLKDELGNRVGMLYVGFLEAPYREVKEKIMWLLLLGTGLASLLSIWFGTRLANGVFDPLFRMNYTMNRVEAGDVNARVGTLSRNDEFSELAQHFDELLDKLAQRRLQLEALNSALDARVVSRTAELVEANQMLRSAQEQMIASERLATIGQLTAGVAHEVNNPLAVMQGHLDLMREALINGDSIAHEIKLLDEQVQRMRQIVQKLLQFMRPESYAGYVEPLDVNETIRDAELLIEQELRLAQVKPFYDLAATHRVTISRTELQQVLVNVLINACHATASLENAGVRRPCIWITSRDIELNGQPAVEIAIENNGPAIHKTHMDLIFDLFFTTKRQKGTGLGLPVSKMVLQRYGGYLSAESPVLHPYDPSLPGEGGARFVMQLLQKARFSSDMIQQAISLTKKGVQNNSNGDVVS